MTAAALAVSPADVRAAAETLRDGIASTPCTHSRTLSEITGAEVFLKFENLQFTGSFKDRGALVKLQSLGPAEREAGVIAMSRGNHAQAVAYHAQRLGIPAVIVMPLHTPATKVEHTRAFGAEVVLEGEGLDEARACAEQLARERGLVLVHPYDDPRVIAGQGTIALEMLAAEPGLDALVVPIGGGGLIAGNAVAAKDARPEIEVIGVETARYPSMRQALEGVPIACGTSTVADGIAVKEPGLLTREIVRACVDEIRLVDEASIEEAVLLLLEVEKTVVEGAGAVGLAALLDDRERFRGRRVGLIVSGGNIDLSVLSAIIQRGLVRTHRLVRLRVSLRDVPDSLALVTRCLSSAGANVVEVFHHRRFSQLPLEAVEVEFVLETRGPEHEKEVIGALQAAGFAPRLASPPRDPRALPGDPPWRATRSR